MTLLVETFDPQDLPEIRSLAAARGEAECRWEEGRVRRVEVSPWFGNEGKGGRDEAAPADSARASSAGSTANVPAPSPRGEGEARQGVGASWREPLSSALTPLALFGAGHVGRAVALALAPLPFAVRWIDSRDDAFPAHVPANASPVHARDPAAEAAALPPDALVLIMTHDHALDLAVTAAALRRGFPFVGLIGSDTKRARFERRLAELGLSQDRIRALRCPIGVPGIRGKEPPVIAAAAVAQLLLVRDNGA